MSPPGEGVSISATGSALRYVHRALRPGRALSSSTSPGRSRKRSATSIGASSSSSGRASRRTPGARFEPMWVVGSGIAASISAGWLPSILRTRSISSMPSRRAIVLAIALAVVVPSCATAPSPAPTAAGPSNAVTVAAATSTPAATVDRVAGWQSDLALLVPGMDRLHPNLGHGTPVAELEAAASQLTDAAATLTDDQLLIGVLRIVAMVSAKGCDAHTGAFIWGTGTYPVDSLPLRLWLFDDDVVVVDALAPYQGLIGLRIDTINSHPIAELLASLDPLIPRDNEQTVRL